MEKRPQKSEVEKLWNLELAEEVREKFVVVQSELDRRESNLLLTVPSSKIFVCG